MLILRAFLLLFIANQLQAYRLVCYLSNWAQYRVDAGKFFPKNVDPNLCTHLIYAFAKLTNYQLDKFEWNDETLYQQTVDLKSSNPGLKILLAVGGWNAGSGDFSKMSSNDKLRSEFASSAVTFLQKYKFDGLDLDWEYPANREGSSPSDKQNFVKLCQDLQAAFKPHKLLLSAALASGISTVQTAYDIAGISKYLDFANLMTYDYHGSWESVTGANAPLYASKNAADKLLSVSSTVDYFIKNGMSSDKINLGLPAYGRSWTLSSAQSNAMGSSASGPGVAGKFSGEAGSLAYYEVCPLLKAGWTRKWDDEQKVPYIFKGNQWVNYDDKESLAVKVAYLKSKNLGGAMFWPIDFDDFSGTQCGEGKYPLVNHVKSILSGSEDIKVTTKVTTKPTTTTTTHKPSPTTLSTKTTTKTTQKSTATTVKTTTKASAKTTQNPVSCSSSGDGYFTVKGSKCTEFIRCISGKAYHFKCPSGTLFDVASKTCTNSKGFACPSK